MKLLLRWIQKQKGRNLKPLYEQEFIEIKREKAKMEIIGTMKCSVEQEDVRRYLASRKPKEKRRMGAFGVLTVLV